MALPTPPSLQEATKNSTLGWQHDLESLFHHAKDRFPDVVWELAEEEEVWGHKAIVYARAPPSFQTRYFSRQLESTTALETYPAESTLSLDNTEALAAPTLLRLTTDISPALFSNELEYLYTGKGFGEAFEFLFDTEHSRSPHLSISSGDDAEQAEALRIDKLRKDLVFMWRSRLYSDVRIALTGNFASGAGGHEATTAIFSSHRFILVSRSSYFHTALIAWPNTRTDPNEPPTLTLPSPPFTPASVHFTLGFLYTGTLIFSHRSYDLSTAFAILRSSLYLNLDTLHDEIQARIAQEMLHGLFHAFLEFPEYEALTQGRWGTGGCRCRQCARRAPRVLAFAVSEDVHNVLLERGARRALVGMFGEGWATQEFAQLTPKLRDSLLKGVSKRTTAANALPLLFAAEHALLKLANSIEPWADTVRDAILAARARIDEVITREAEAVFSGEEWEAVVGDGSGSSFDDAERVEWTMAAVMRGVRGEWAPTLYQTLVSTILLRQHPTEPNMPLLAATSNIRTQVEQTRVDLVKFIGKDWLNIRQARGFDELEGWSLKEISNDIEVSIDDLLSPPSYSSPARRPPPHLRPASGHPHTSRADAASDATSMRVSVLSRVAASSRGPHSSHGPNSGTPSLRPGAAQGSGGGGRTPSVHSLARSVVSTASSVSTRSTATVSTVSAAPRRRVTPAGQTEEMSPARRVVVETRMKDRPDSKFVDDVPRSDADADTTDGGEEHDRTPEASDAGDRDNGGDGGGEGEGESPHSDAADSGRPPQSSPRAVKKTLITRASLASVTSNVSRRVPAASGTVTPLKPKRALLAGSEDRGVRSRTASAASTASVSPSVRARTTTHTGVSNVNASLSPNSAARPGSRGSTRPARIVVRTPTGAGTSPRTPKTPSFSRPPSSVSTRSVSGASSRSVSISGNAARPISAVSGAESFRTASAGGSAGTGGGGAGSARPSTAGTRSRRTSGASTISTLSRTTASTTTTGTESAASTTPAVGTTPTRRVTRTPRLTAGTSSPAEERTRRVSGASMRSVASSVKSNVGGTPVRATPVRKAVSAGTPGTGVHLSPAAAIAAAAKARPAARPVKRGGAAGAGGAKGRAVSAGSTSTSASETGGDETVVLTVPPVIDVTEKVSDEAKEVEAANIDELAEEEEKKIDADVTMDTEEDATVKIPLSSAMDTDKEQPAPPAEEVDSDDDMYAPSIPAPVGASFSSPEQPPEAALAVPDDTTAGAGKTSSTITVRPSPRQEAARVDTAHTKSSSSASSSSVATLRRRGSNDTIRTARSAGVSVRSGGVPSVQEDVPQPTPTAAPQPPTHPSPPSPRHALTKQLSSIDHILADDTPQGATLDIGIPCIIASQRKRFKAYARYIGEVRGETGPWVGVEVPLPLGDGAWGDADTRPSDGRAWHDGSWGGIRYFDISGGVGGSEWEYGYGGVAGGGDIARRRRGEGGVFARGGSGSMGMSFGGTKREGDQLSIASERMKRMRSVSPAQSDVESGTESRGLFVRPQQVLYVVDAVGADF